MDLLISMLVLFTFSVFMTWKWKLNVTVTPFVSLSFIIIVLAFCGMLQMLVPGMILVYVCAVACAGYLIVKERKNWKEMAKAVLRPGLVFFFAATLFFWFTLKSKNAGFRIWDEFSFWGTAAKVVFEEKKLYTLVNTSMINVSYPPGLALNSLFLQFLSPEFTEWKTYTAYNMLAMAAVTPLFSRLEWKNPLGVLATAGIGLLYRGDDGAVLDPYGLLLVFLSALSYAIYLVAVNKGRMKEIPTLKLTLYVIVFGLFLFAFRFQPATFSILSAKPLLWVSAFCMALFPTAISLLCTSAAIQKIGSTPVAILGAMEPVTAVAIAILIFNEQLTVRLSIGMLLVITSVTFIIAGGSITHHLLRVRKMFPRIRRNRNPL